VNGRLARKATAAVRRLGASRRSSPTFLIIGAQKAGTTSLHAYLSSHPDVSPPVTKEIHFFDDSYERGEGWYRARFPFRRDGLITGEATPYYLFHPLVPERVAATLPEVKLIVLLREPARRAYSHYNHEVAAGREQLSFADALEAEATRLDGEEDRIRADVSYRSYAHRHFSYVARGFYAEQVTRWLQHFDREQLLVVPAEEIFARPRETVLGVQRFLGLDEVQPDDSHAYNSRIYERLDDELRESLQGRFREENARLFELLGRQFDWG
jgi:Sulfotransferase domain